MRIWFPAMAPFTWLLAIALPLCLPTSAQAHTMYVRYRVLLGNQIQIESFFQGGSPAIDGIVRIFRPDGSLLAPPAVLDERGLYVFSYQKAETLRVRVSCDEHAKEIVIPASELTDARAESVPTLDRTEPSHSAEILAGFSLILALAAFYLSVRTAARLRTLHATQVSSPMPTQSCEHGTLRPADLTEEM
jgi:hypothetical protein